MRAHKLWKRMKSFSGFCRFLRQPMGKSWPLFYSFFPDERATTCRVMNIVHCGQILHFALVTQASVTGRYAVYRTDNDQDVDVVCFRSVQRCLIICLSCRGRLQVANRRTGLVTVPWCCLANIAIQLIYGEMYWDADMLIVEILCGQSDQQCSIRSCLI